MMNDSLNRKHENPNQKANFLESWINNNQSNSPSRQFKIPSSKPKPSIFNKDGKRPCGIHEDHGFDKPKYSVGDVGQSSDHHQSFDHSILRYQNPMPYRCAQTPPIQRHAPPPLIAASSRSSPTSQIGDLRGQGILSSVSHLPIGHVISPIKSPNKSVQRSHRESSLPIGHSEDVSPPQQNRSASAMGRSLALTGQNGSSNNTKPTNQIVDKTEKNTSRALFRPFTKRAPHLASIKAHPHNEPADELSLRQNEDHSSQPMNERHISKPLSSSVDRNNLKSYKQTVIDGRVKLNDKSPDSSGYHSHSNEPSFSISHGSPKHEPLIQQSRSHNHHSQPVSSSASPLTEKSVRHPDDSIRIPPVEGPADLYKSRDDALSDMREKMEKNEAVIIAMYSDKISKLERKLDQEYRDKQKLEENCKSMFSRLEVGEKSLRQLNGDLSQSSNECVELRQKLAESQAECCRLDTRCVNLEMALKEMALELDYLTANLSAKQSQPKTHKSTQIALEAFRSPKLPNHPSLNGESTNSLKAMVIQQAKDFEQERATWLSEKRKVIDYQKQLQLTHEQLQRKIERLEGRVVLLSDELKHKNKLLLDYTSKSVHNGKNISNGSPDRRQHGGGMLEKSHDTQL